MLPAILDHGGPVVVLDIKGENFAVTRRWRASLGRRVAVLNPFGVIEPSRNRFNPLDYLRPEHLGRDAALLADGLIRPEPGAESHFTDIARTLLTAALEVTAATAAPAQRTLPAVADRLLGPTVLEELKGWAAQPGWCGGRPAQAAAAVLRAGDREQGSFFTTLARTLDWLASEPMREFLSRSDVDLEALLDDRLDLYLVVPLDLVAQQANFLRLLTNLVLGTVIRQDGRRQLRERLLLVLDEFTRLGPMTQLMTIATVAAGAGIEALFVAQDKGSLDAVWGPAGAGTLLGSCATVRVFGLGRTDGVTAQWAEQQLGHRTLYTHSRRTGGLGAVDARDGSRSEVRDRLLTARADPGAAARADAVLPACPSAAPARPPAVPPPPRLPRPARPQPDPARLSVSAAMSLIALEDKQAVPHSVAAVRSATGSP